MPLSKFVDNIKSVFSRRLRNEFETELRKTYGNWGKGFWSESDSIDSCGDVPLDVLRKDMQDQTGCMSDSAPRSV